MKRPLLCFAFMWCGVSFAHADQTIRSLQQTLKNQGFYYGTVTGDKSAETTAAIRRYQIRNGLQVTGEFNEETARSLNSTSHAVTAVSRPNSKPAPVEPNSARPDVNAHLIQNSQPPSFGQPERALQTNPSAAASFYQPGPLRINRRIIAGIQHQLMSWGYYRGRVDGKYGPQTTFAVRAFQASAGVAPTGALDTQTLEALGLSDASLAQMAPAPVKYETWIPVRKFKHGRWKVKWKKQHRHPVEEYAGADERQPNLGYRWQDYYNED